MLANLLNSPWWVLLLAAVGAVAVVTVFITLFSALGDRPGVAWVTRAFPVDSPDFLLALSGMANSPLQTGGTARLLNNGDQFYPAILEALRRAEKTIDFMVYIWHDGRVSDQIFDALIERASQGVGVRVLIDGLGGHNAPAERIAALRRAGGKWVWFHPPRFGKLTRFHRRNHRRVIVIDGKVGFTGGAAVHDQWLGCAQDPAHWRDSMVELRGCVATNLQAAFAQLWSQETGELLAGPEFYPPDHEAAEAEGGSEPVSRHVNVVSSPSSESHELRYVFWLSFRSAEKRLYICNPYFVPDDVTCAVLKERARAGVDVRVLVPNEHIDIPLIRWAAHHYYDEMLAAGIRIYEYQPTMIHQKLVVIDSVWSIIGSANMDVRSRELNQENVLGILDEGFARQVEHTFLVDLEHARELHLDEWRRRPLWQRARERVSVVFEEQF